MFLRKWAGATARTDWMRQWMERGRDNWDRRHPDGNRRRANTELPHVHLVRKAWVKEWARHLLYPIRLYLMVLYGRKIG